MAEYYHYTEKRNVAGISAKGMYPSLNDNDIFTSEGSLRSDAEVLDRFGVKGRGEAVLKFADDGNFQPGKPPFVEPNPDAGSRSYKGGGAQYRYTGKGPLKPIEGRNIEDKNWLPIVEYLKKL